MTLSNKQRVIIWMVAILIVLLWGLQMERVVGPNEGVVVEKLTCYGKRIVPPRLIYKAGYIDRDHPLYWIANQKRILIPATALTGAILMIISRNGRKRVFPKKKDDLI